MTVGSFRLVAFSLIVPLLVVACGSSSTPPQTTTAAAGPTQTIRGPGFAFETPATWRLSHTLTSATARSRAAHPASVWVQLFRTGKAYSPAEFDTAAKELDRTAQRLAAAGGGTVTSAETTTVAGRRIRAYRLSVTRGKYRIGFLLDGKRELELACKAPQGGDPDGACALLFSSFRLTGR